MRRMPVVIAIVVLAAALALAQGNKDEEIRKIIKSRKVTLSFSDCSIANVVSFLQDISGLNIVIDPKCDSELTTTIRLRDITMENALKVMLQPLDLDYVVKNGAVFIATKKRIAELKGASQKKPPAGLEPGQLLLLLKDGSKLKGRVAIDIWKLKTAYGLLEIPSGEMKIIRLPHEAKEGEKSPAEDEVETIRFTVTGRLELDKLEVDTGKGKLSIPKSEIKEILFPKSDDKSGKVKRATKAEVAACASNLRQIHTACMLYEQDNRIFPFAGEDAKAYEHLQLLVDAGYIEDSKVFVSPASGTEKPARMDKDEHFMLSEATCSYAYTKVIRSSTSKASRCIAASKRLINRQDVKGLNILYIGGNVEWVEAEEKSWEDLTKGLLTK